MAQAYRAAVRTKQEHPCEALEGGLEARKDASASAPASEAVPGFQPPFQSLAGASSRLGNPATGKPNTAGPGPGPGPRRAAPDKLVTGPQMPLASPARGAGQAEGVDGRGMVGSGLPGFLGPLQSLCVRFTITP